MSRPAPKSTSAAAARECGAATACRCTRTTIKLLPLVWRAETGAEEAVEPAAAHESCCCRPSIRTAPQRTRARSPPHAASPTRVWRLENARCAPAGDGAPCNVCGGDRGFVSQDQRRPRPIAPPPRCPTPSRCAWHHSRTWQRRFTGAEVQWNACSARWRALQRGHRVGCPAVATQPAGQTTSFSGSRCAQIHCV